MYIVEINILMLPKAGLGGTGIGEVFTLIPPGHVAEPQRSLRVYRDAGGVDGAQAPA